MPGDLSITLRPRGERNVVVETIIQRLKRAVADVPGMTVYFQPVQDIQISTRPSRAQYQYTLVATDAAEVAKWSDALVDALRQNPTLRDVSSEAQEGGLRAFINVDREKAGRLGISMQVINDTLNDAFGQRQISTIYGQANQYRVILEAAPQYQRDPSALQKIYMPANIPSQPLQSSSAQNIQPLRPSCRRIEHAGAARGLCRDDPHHRAARDRAPGAVPLGDAQLQPRARRGARRCGRHHRVAERIIGMPTSVIGSYSGDTAEFAKSLAGEPWLILAAIVTIYIVLGVLYESFIHPFTILTTLPSAGVGRAARADAVRAGSLGRSR